MVYNHPGITNFITNNLPIDKMLKSGKLLFFLFFIDRQIKKKQFHVKSLNTFSNICIKLYKICLAVCLKNWSLVGQLLYKIIIKW